MVSWNNIFTLALGLIGSARAYTNPIRNPGGGDPQITYTGGYYYLISTEWTNLQLSRATTIEGLKTATPKVIYTDSDPSRSSNVWAPELHYLGGKWYIYYTAGKSEDLTGQRSHVIKGGATPWDSWSYGAKLSDDWGIDGTILRTNQFGNYFVYSCMTGVQYQSTCIRKLGSDFLSVGALSIISQPDQSWEKSGTPVQEGPNALYFGGKTYISYSANYCWTPDYCVALLEWDGKTDPAKASAWKKSNGCVLKSANGSYGTGHNSFFQSPDGKQTFITFHATSNKNGACDDTRYAMTQPLTANADGTPNFGSVQPFSHQFAEPSSALHAIAVKMEVNYTAITDYYMIRCFSGGNFYVCKKPSTSSEFVGCCDSDPCADGSGICPQTDLRPMSYSPGRTAYKLGLECGALHNASFYRCDLSMPHFLGCCGVDPCARGCPQSQLIPAQLPALEGWRKLFLEPYRVQNNTASDLRPGVEVNSTFEAPDFSNINWDRGKHEVGPATVIGLCAGFLAASLLVLGLIRHYWYRPSSTSPKHEQADTAHAPFLAHDSSDDVAYSQMEETIPHTRIRDNWHGGPKTLEHLDVPTVFGWIFSVLLTFTPLCFIALAITAIRLDNQPHSDYGKTVLQLTVLSPSLYPILFAALVGRFYRVFGRWCLESRGGVNLPVLEQLIGSQNLATAIERIFVIRTNAVIGIIILTSWLLSPLGGQSSSRLLQDAKFDLVSNGTVYYADPAYQVSHSRWIDYRHSVGATYAASLLSSSKQKASPRDIWGLPKIPQLSQDRLDNGSYDLYDVKKSDLVSGKASYASLLGIKIQGLVRPNEPTKFNFTISTSYFHVDCDFVDSFDPLRGKLTQNQTNIVDLFYKYPSFSAFNILPQSWFNADGEEDDINSPYQFIYVKQMRGSQLYVVKCATHEIKVETTIHCGPGDPATTCEPRQQRRLSTENQTGTSLFPPSVTRSDLRLKELSYALYAWAQASGDKDGVQPSPSEMYLMKDENPYEFTSQLPWTKEDLAKFPYVFSRRMTTAFNTYWDAGLNPGGHTNVSYSTIPLHNMNGLETGQTYKDSFMNTTMGTRITTIDVYSAQRIWVGLLLFTTMVLQILAICGLIIEILIQGPDVLGFASTLTRDNPFVPLPAGGSHLDGPERARCLKNMRLELVDVRPEDETGYLAVRAVSSAKGQDTSVIEGSVKSRKWVHLNRRRLYE
ncbi:Uncharacterized protein LW94_14566 [Fusarium fujikuroi]|nr:Uncharacterized protein LW94_14566 [Fusarium fujikuroi]